MGRPWRFSGIRATLNQMAGDYADDAASTFREAFENLELQPRQRNHLEERWLDRLLWHELKATLDARKYLALRLTVLIGAATATAFAGLTLAGAKATWVSGLIFALALATTIAAGILELFKVGERARHHRAIAETLKHEGWLFLQSAGPYRGRSPSDSFPEFSSRIEAILDDGGGWVVEKRLQKVTAAPTAPAE